MYINPNPLTDEFIMRKKDIAQIYQAAFSGYPWFEDLSSEEVNRRIDAQIAKNGFTAFLAKDQNEILGSLWYDLLDLAVLENERGQELREFAEGLLTKHSIPHIVWGRETLVKPEVQGQGIATGLRAVFLEHLRVQFPKGVLILTRMRDDNFGIIKTAEKVGYQRTGIKVRSTISPMTHEYWWKLILS